MAEALASARPTAARLRTNRCSIIFQFNRLNEIYLHLHPLRATDCD